MIEPSAVAHHQLLPFVIFTFVASITPGPSNFPVLGNDAGYGFVAALLIVWGSYAGSAALVLIVSFDMGGWLAAHPRIQAAMGWGGALCMSYLAWQIASRPTSIARPTTDKPTSGMTAAALRER